MSRIGVMGLAVMGQNLALNIADKGFVVSVWNRSPDKVDETAKRAVEEKVGDRLRPFKDMKEFINSIAKPRAVIMMIQAGKPVDETVDKVKELLEPGDLLIDGGNEWYQNTEKRAELVKPKGIMYVGMGVSGGEEGARHGPSLMPGGPIEAYKILEPIITKIAAQVNDGPCVTHIGDGGAGNYVKMIHNGIEYGDMQLIAEAYDVLKNVGGLTNQELADVFATWNKGVLDSFLIEITSIVLRHKEPDGSYTVDSIQDKTGQKGTGKWTAQEAAENGVACPTITAALDARFLSALLDQRVKLAKLIPGPQNAGPAPSKQKLIDSLENALYAAKICSYTQGMNLIKEAGKNHKWQLNLGAIARIWKGGCIIRAKFLDRIKAAYDRNANLDSLFFDPEFAKEINERQGFLREIIVLGIQHGISLPAFSASLAYLDQSRRPRLPANLTQAQRDFFGAHTYMKLDGTGPFHTEWQKQ